MQDDPITLYGDGRQVRDVLCVSDLVSAFEAARKNVEVTRTEVYNVGGGPQNSISLLELMDEIELLTGRPLERTLDTRRAGDQLLYITDNSKIQRDTGWKPEIGLKKTIKLLQEFWEQNNAMLAARRRTAPPALSSFAVAAELSGRVG
jgi:CDP-paratose 2-epimerase